MNNPVYKFLTVFLFINTLVQGQTIGPEVIQQLALPSPQAREITRYGNTPVDEVHGKVSATIPIHTYSVGAITVPITLGYSAAGVKVEQKPTWTGINWVLNAGGVINRVVKDLPDEYPQPRLLYSRQELEDMREYRVDPEIPEHTSLRLPDSLAFLLAEAPDAADSEADAFSFSFPGHSGSFFLKGIGTNQPFGVLLKHDSELKIDVLGSFTKFGAFEFRITTPDGTKYYFGGRTGANGMGPTSYEETQLIRRDGGIPQYGKRAKTSFYLTKIENIVGDIVLFEYESKDQYEVFVASNVSLSTILYALNSSGGLSQDPLPCLAPEMVPNVSSNLIKNVVFNGRFLKRISNNRTAQQVEFDSFWVEKNLGEFPNGIQFRVLSKINYGFGKAILEYYPNKESLSSHDSREKFFLESVSFTTQDEIVENKFRLSYNDPLSFPRNAVSNAQDYLGYFNGKSNPTLLPKNSLQFLAPFSGDIPQYERMNFSNYENYLGDRSTSFLHAMKGTLSELQYPTGGRTLFEYEPVVKDRYSYATRHLHAYRNAGSYTSNDPSEMPTDANGFRCDQALALEGLQNTEHVFIDQTIKLHLTIRAFERSKVNHGDYIYIKKATCGSNAVSVYDNVEEKKWFFPDPSPNSSQIEFNTTIEFSIKAGSRYSFEIGFKSGLHGLLEVRNAPVEAIATYTYINGKVDNEGPGVRLLRVKDFTDPGASPYVKRYYYNGVRSVLNSSEGEMSSSYYPRFHSTKGTLLTCGPLNSIQAYLVGTLNSNSYSQNFDGTDFGTFPIVTVSLGGDNFEKGGIEKHFLLKRDEYQKIFSSISSSGSNLTNPLSSEKYLMQYDEAGKTNMAELTGLLTKEIAWKRDGSLLKKINQKTFDYICNVKDSVFSIVGRKLVTPPLLIGFHHYYATYTTYSHKITKNSR